MTLTYATIMKNSYDNWAYITDILLTIQPSIILTQGALIYFSWLFWAINKEIPQITFDSIQLFLSTFLSKTVSMLSDLIHDNNNIYNSIVIQSSKQWPRILTTKCWSIWEAFKYFAYGTQRSTNWESQCIRLTKAMLICILYRIVYLPFPLWSSK